MKKRILSLLLLVGTLLSTFPVLGVAAETALPKSEDAGSLSETDITPTGSHSFTAYDALYVGADGAKTANGGNLIGLYTAYAGDASVDTENAKWKNKMDATGATDATLRDTSDTVSFVKEANGFGYHMTKDQVMDNYEKIGLTLPDAWASFDQFTVEQTACFDMMECKEPLAKQFSYIRLDVLHGMWMAGKGDLADVQSYCMRWQISSKVSGWAQGSSAYNTAYQEFAYRNAYFAAGKTGALVATYTKSVAADGNISFLITYNTGVNYPATRTYTAAEIRAMREEAVTSNKTPAFSLFNGMSGTMYAVRVYDAPLTATERQHNATVDVLAHAGVDVSEYASLEKSKWTVIDSVLSLAPYR